MEIQVVAVGKPAQVTKGNKSWTEVEIQYIGKSGAGNRKIRSFEGDVYTAVQQLQSGDKAEVTVVKEGQYFNWKGINKLAGGVAPATGGDTGGNVGGTSTGTRKAGDWETSSERAAKQVYIVRQSCIANAIGMLSLNNADPLSVDEVVEVARKFEEFVFESDEPETTGTKVATKSRGRPKKTTTTTSAEGIQ